jgi:hypothetical protein
LNIDQLQLLDPETKARYIQAERWYASKEWKDLKEWLIEQVDQAKGRAAFAETWEQNRLNIGMVSAYNILLSQEELVFQEFDEVVQDIEEPDDVGDLQL